MGGMRYAGETKVILIMPKVLNDGYVDPGLPPNTIWNLRFISDYTYAFE